MMMTDIFDKNTAVWFEIPSTDFSRAVSFYEQVFKVKLNPEEMGGHRMGIFPHAGEAISGCVIHGEGYAPSAMGSVVYLNGTSDLAEPLARVEKSGGKVVVPKTKISDEIGYFAHFLDTEGNRVGLYSMH
jgi:uncharacterized protein